MEDWVASFTRVPRALTPPVLWSLIDGVGRNVGLFGSETPTVTIQEVPEALLIARSDGRIALANARAAALFGRSVGELADMPLDALFRVSRSTNGDDAFELLGYSRTKTAEHLQISLCLLTKFLLLCPVINDCCIAKGMGAEAMFGMSEYIMPL